MKTKTRFNPLSEKKVQKLSLGLYLFKKSTFAHFRC